MSDAVLLASWPAPDNIVAGTTLRRGGETNLPARPQAINQIHGARAVLLGSTDFDGGTPDADAVIGTQSGDICVVQSADCLPVLLCSSDGQEIAAVHAGWRGLADGVIEATVARMVSTASDLIAWFGPAISQEAFEVGDDVHRKFHPWSDNDNGLFVANNRGRWQADLFGLASARLEKMGIGEIYGDRLCTYEDSERFFSYRRDGKTGRLLSFIHRHS